MKPIALLTASLCLLTLTSAHAIDAKYRQKLERSGCTQMSEMQGCDINKTRAENAKAGFVNDAAPAAAPKAAPAAKPSFDCAKAKPGSSEAIICADPALAALDRQLADVYAAARKKATNEKPPVLQAEQRGWVKGRDECWKAQQGGQAACMRGAYVDRIAELQARYRLVASDGPVFLACDGIRPTKRRQSGQRSGGDLLPHRAAHADRRARRPDLADGAPERRRRALPGPQRNPGAARRRIAGHLGLPGAGDALPPRQALSAAPAATRPQAQGALSLGQFAITVANMARLSRITFSRQSGEEG